MRVSSHPSKNKEVISVVGLNNLVVGSGLSDLIAGMARTQDMYVSMSVSDERSEGGGLRL